MKKILNYPYLDHIIKIIITFLVTATLYFIIDTRDFIKFKQPLKDKEQDYNCLRDYNELKNNLKTLDSIIILKNKNLDFRIDNLDFKINELNKKIDYLLNYKIYSYEYEDK